MSSLAIHPTPSLLQNIDKKVMITIIGFLVAAIIGAVSFASAAPEGKCKYYRKGLTCGLWRRGSEAWETFRTPCRSALWSFLILVFLSYF